MSEYNWRAEREKYRSDFRKEAEQPTLQMAPEAARKFNFANKYFISGIILLLAVIIAVIYMFRDNDSSTLLAEIAEKHKTAVGLVTLNIETHSGDKLVLPIGTAWAFDQKRFATNGHVANDLKNSLRQYIDFRVQNLLENEAKQQNCKSLKEYLEKLSSQADTVISRAERKVLSVIKNAYAEIVINGTAKKSYSVAYVQVHKDYGIVGTKYSPDLAVLTILEKHDNYFKLADKETLYKLKSGDAIAFLGFPMENLSDNNVHVDNPVASMQSGIVVAVSDFDLKDAGGDRNFFLRHNLPATGGASGSPIFTRDGKVIAALFGGNIIGNVVNGQVERMPSAVQINFGVRIDLLSGVGEAVAISDFLKL